MSYLYISGVNKKNKHNVVYPDIPSAIKPIPHGPEVQTQLNDLTRDLGLSKENAQLLGSRLSESSLLSEETTYFWFRNRDEQFRRYFTFDFENSLVYCNDVKGLIEALGVTYRPQEWRLFIDSSTRSLKAVLLNIGNKIASVPIGYSVQLKENYETMNLLVKSIKYTDHNWLICADLKVRHIFFYIAILLSAFLNVKHLNICFHY